MATAIRGANRELGLFQIEPRSTPAPPVSFGCLEANQVVARAHAPLRAYARVRRPACGGWQGARRAWSVAAIALRLELARVDQPSQLL
jgi:hypothetical protein